MKQISDFQLPIANCVRYQRVLSQSKIGNWKSEIGNNLAPAFSLIELMIAIMILGIGLTMVATVFPVGLDMTRDTVQMAISQGAADAAVATVQLKVPGLKDIDTVDPAVSTLAIHRVLVPDVLDIEIAQGSDPSPAFINTAEFEVIDALRLPALNSIIPINCPPGVTCPNASDPISYMSWDTWVGRSVDATGTLAPAALTPNQQNPEDFIDRCRVYTERTGWDAELDPNGSNNAYVLPGENLPADMPAGGYTVIPAMLVPKFANTAIAPPPARADMIRIHLADSVYPPIEYTYDTTVTGYDPTNPATWTRTRSDPTGPPADVDAFFQELTERKYSWTVLHHLVSSGNGSRQMMLTIVVTHRGEASSRYARQKDQRTPLPTGSARLYFDLNPTVLGSGAGMDPMNSMALPKPDDDTTDNTPGNGLFDTDMLFPQPWLVLLDTVNTATGEVNCTADVARLLPAGSFFVIAQSTDATLMAGTPKDVIASSWNAIDLGNNTPPLKGILQIKKVEMGGGTFNNVPVWVFPPAIESRGNPDRFGTRSPVVGVALRGVPTQ